MIGRAGSVGRIGGQQRLLFQPPSGNMIANYAGSGTGGTNGLPNGWTASWVAGVTFSVLSRTPYRGGFIIEFLFSGTAAGNGACNIFFSSATAIPASAGQTWRHRIYGERVGGAASPGEVGLTGHNLSASVGWITSFPSANINGAITGPQIAPADNVTPANTAYLYPHFYRQITTGQVVNLRYKIFAPVLWRIS